MPSHEHALLDAGQAQRVIEAYNSPDVEMLPLWRYRVAFQQCPQLGSHADRGG
jgi:hypothetical protein